MQAEIKYFDSRENRKFMLKPNLLVGHSRKWVV